LFWVLLLVVDGAPVEASPKVIMDADRERGERALDLTGAR
jgi:hypothetical protein